MIGRQEQPQSPRFEVLRRLGEGAFGAVDEVLDLRTGAVVARKTLRAADPAGLLAFKDQFRTLCRLNHKSLVSLFELFMDGDHYSYTMEVVDGVDLLAWVHPGARERQQPVGLARPGANFVGDVDRIYDCFGQLAAVLSFLHEHGVIHGDVKPANVLVRSDGALKLLDVGLAPALGPDSGDVLAGAWFGTPDYLAPEAGTAPRSPAADWYALGVMLYEALTGQRPFSGAPMQVIAARQMLDPLPPAQVAPGVPSDLDALCMALLRRSPDLRPDAEHVLAALGAQPGGGRERFAHRARSFIGRRVELAEMENIFGDVASGATRALAVSGTSGMGKTALVQRFVERLERRRLALVLSSRCYEREDLPFKALDGIMDALGSWLGALPHHQRDALGLWPETAVVRLFPQLGEARGEARAKDPGDLRQEAFEGIAALVGRVARLRPVVILVDDLQWGDADSAALLAALLEPPGPGRLLVVGCYRSGGPTAPWIDGLLSIPLGTCALARIEISALPMVEATSMALERLAEAPVVPHAMALAPRVAREALGCPYFIEELARHVRAGEPVAAALSGVDDAISARVARLPKNARALLEVIACAGRPVAEPLLLVAVGCSEPHAAGQLVLEAERLARIVTAGGERMVEAYHDRIRETVVARMSRARSVDAHRSLARAYLQSGATDPEILLVHHEQAGDLVAAMGAARHAAARARDALAFEEAARLWALAVELYGRVEAGEHDSSREPSPGAPPRLERSSSDGSHDGFSAPGVTPSPRAPASCAEEKLELLMELAQALEHAGRGPEAAAAYLRACAHAPPPLALELRRRAAERLLFSGHVEAGREAVRPVLEATGLPMPRTRVEATAHLVAARVALRILDPVRLRLSDSARPVSAEVAVRLDVCRSLASGFALVDPLLAAVYQSRYFLLAAWSRDPRRLAHALAVELPFAAAVGVSSRARVGRLQRRTAQLTEQLDDPYLRAFADLASGAAAWLHGDWAGVQRLCGRASAGLAKCSPPPLDELGTMSLLSADAASWLGDFTWIRTELTGWLARARARGDRYRECHLTMRFVAMGHLLEDAPDRAERAIERSVRRWPATGVATMTLWAAISRATAALYRGDARRALDGLLAERPQLLSAGLLRVQLYALLVADIVGRTAAVAAMTARPVERARLLLVVEREARVLLSSGAPWAKGLGEVLRAAALWRVAALSGAIGSLLSAGRSFRAAGMRVHALAAERQAAVGWGGGGGTADVAALDAELASLGIANPARVAAITVPVFTQSHP